MIAKWSANVQSVLREIFKSATGAASPSTKGCNATIYQNASWS